MAIELTDVSINSIADSAIKPTFPMHVVNADDTTASPEGTSERINIGQLRYGVLDVALVTPLGGGQAGAAPLLAYENFIDAVGTAGFGVRMTSDTANFSQVINNYDEDEDLLIYPKSGANFRGLAANAPLTLSAGSSVRLRIVTTGEIRHL
jgi:hypothetical protein